MIKASPASASTAPLPSPTKASVPCTDELLDQEAQKILHQNFIKRYGHPPQFYAQAPGRVNLIGEHIDYAGYGVLPMAISRTVVLAISSSSSSSCRTTQQKQNDKQYEQASVVRVQHVNQKYFSNGQFPADPCAKIIPSSDQNGHDWVRYVQCGYKGAWNLHESQLAINDEGSERNEAIGQALNILVWGNIPLAAGLSSSSALVVASLLAALSARGRKYTGTLEDLSNIAARSEALVGTMGGGMDHVSSMMGHARLVDFHPTIRTKLVSLPPKSVFVIANSLTPSHKAVGAHLRFNKRVVEMMLASKILALKLDLPNPLSFRSFRQVQDRYAANMTPKTVKFEDMIHLAQKYLKPGGYTNQDLREVLSHPSSEWFANCVEKGEGEAKRIKEVQREAQAYFLQERALHVYGEAERVRMFHHVCCENASDGGSARMAELGRLMNASHESCAKLYDCSCEELDKLVEMCLNLGAIGSRLTGAGWGGCTVSLVEEDKVQALLEGLKRTYYKGHVEEGKEFSKICFPAVATLGACLYFPTEGGTDEFVLEGKDGQALDLF